MAYTTYAEDPLRVIESNLAAIAEAAHQRIFQRASYDLIEGENVTKLCENIFGISPYISSTVRGVSFSYNGYTKPLLDTFAPYFFKAENSRIALSCYSPQISASLMNKGFHERQNIRGLQTHSLFIPTPLAHTDFYLINKSAWQWCTQYSERKLPGAFTGSTQADHMARIFARLVIFGSEKKFLTILRSHQRKSGNLFDAFFDMHDAYDLPICGIASFAAQALPQLLCSKFVSTMVSFDGITWFAEETNLFDWITMDESVTPAIPGEALTHLSRGMQNEASFKHFRIGNMIVLPRACSEVELLPSSMYRQKVRVVCIKELDSAKSEAA